MNVVERTTISGLLLQALLLLVANGVSSKRSTFVDCFAAISVALTLLPYNRAVNRIENSAELTPEK